MSTRPVGGAGALPTWCEVERGPGPVLFVAPHGGRRPVYERSAPPVQRRVNDLYTPEVTRLLAAALQAGRLVNRGLDRNDIDLNRLSDVRRYAPVFLAHVVDEVGAIIARHGHAEIAFIHGWNTGQTRCDIGIGAREVGGDVVAMDGACVTVQPAYLAGRVAHLQAACAAVGIEAGIGEKYPAGHRNNLLQAFSRRFADTTDPHLRQLHDWATAGQLDALQLELGIPLRWPGPVRDRFLAAVVAAFRGDGCAARHAVCDEPTRLPAMRSSTLQFYDPITDVGLAAAFGRVGSAAHGARLLLFLGGSQVALFTGEVGLTAGAGVAPLRLEGANGEVRLGFDGPVLMLDDGRHYVDVEDALARSRLVDIRLAVHGDVIATADHGPTFARLAGQVSVNGQVRSLRVNAFGNLGSHTVAPAAEQMTVAASFDRDVGLLARTHGEPAGAAVRFGLPHTERRTLVGSAIDSDASAYSPERVRLDLADGDTIEADLQPRMAIVRPLHGATYARVTFGVTRCRWRGATGWGLFEYARVVSAGAAASDAVAVRP